MSNNNDTLQASDGFAMILYGTKFWGENESTLIPPKYFCPLNRDSTV